MRIRKDDRVRVISGKHLGETGRVLGVNPSTGKVLIEGVNKIKRHLRVQQTQRGGQTGGITEREAWMDGSNVQPLCRSCDKPSRVRHQVVDGTKRRLCVRCGGEL